MNIPPELQAYFESVGFKPDMRPIMTDVLDFEKEMYELHGTLTDPAQKKEFGEVLAQLTKAREEAARVVPEVLHELKTDCEKMKVEAEADQNELERLWSEIQGKLATAAAAAAAAPAAAAAVPLPSVDPTLGVALTASLLGRFGKKPDKEKTPKDAGAVHEAWVETDHAAEAPPPPTPAPPASVKETKKTQTRKKSEDDIWEGLSRMED